VLRSDGRWRLEGGGGAAARVGVRGRTMRQRAGGLQSGVGEEVGHGVGGSRRGGG
jgi:hypothetical protein